MKGIKSVVIAIPILCFLFFSVIPYPISSSSSSKRIAVTNPWWEEYEDGEDYSPCY
ncbi:MAG: hypothetical protein ACFFDH_00210 [Promethearchaeota archaeon]